jgi:hypothetical protein
MDYLVAGIFILALLIFLWVTVDMFINVDYRDDDWYD